MSLNIDIDEGDNYTFAQSQKNVDNNLQVPQDDLKCNQYMIKNKTHFIYGGYEGIPENLLINFLGWLVSTFYFIDLISNFAKCHFFGLRYFRHQ